MQARDVIARAIQDYDNDRIPEGFADDFEDDNVSDWSAYLATLSISALRAAGYVIIKDRTDPEGGIPGRS